MKVTKILGVVLVLSVLLSLSAFAAEPYIIDFENFEIGYEIAGNHEGQYEDEFYRSVNLPIKIVEKDGSKVAVMDQTFPGFNNTYIRFYGEKTSPCKPFATYGAQFTMSYRVFLDVPEGANSLIFRDRVTDSKDNAGFNVLSIWHNQYVESENGQLATVPFGEWFVITNIYDYDEETVTTYINDELAFTQPLPTTINDNVDFSDFCYHTLGNSGGNDTNTGYVYLDNIKWESGAKAPAQTPTTQAPTTQAPSTDVTPVPPAGSDLVSIAILGGAVALTAAAIAISKKRK